MKRVLGELHHSLRGRLLAGTLTWILVSILVAGWALSDLFGQHMARQLASELSVHMNQLVAALSVDEQGQASLAFELSDTRLQQPYSGLYWQIDRLPPEGPPSEALYHSRSLWDQTLRLPSATPETTYAGLVQLPGPRNGSMLALLRVVTPPEGTAAYRLIIAADRHILDEPLAEFRMLLVGFLGLLALGLTTVAIVQVVVGLKPLALLRQRLADVRSGPASRIEGRFPNEVQPLVDEFNAVLHRNGEIVQHARTQAGNLAHAIKTPLSILANAAAREQTPFGHLVAEQVDLATRQVEHHLARARAAAAVRTPGMRSEVQPVIRGLARVLIKLYSDKGVQLNTDVVADSFIFKGEQQDLQEMLGNLMENACKWADRNVQVSVAVHDGDTPGMIVFHVEDDGPGLPEAQRETIFQRGVRMDERMPGSGLGLAIVRDLATAYGGSVQACASSLGGLGINLYLPGESLLPTLPQRSACNPKV